VRLFAPLFLLLAFPLPVNGEEPPSYLKDAVIEVRLKNGELYTFPTKEWMVIKRNSVPECPVCPATPGDLSALRSRNEAQAKLISKLSQQLAEKNAAATATAAQVTPPAPAVVEAPVVPKNRLMATVGLGIEYALREEADATALDSSIAPVFGLQYSRLVYENYSATAGFQSNATGYVGVGLDW
jgi:hypothetical protein